MDLRDYLRELKAQMIRENISRIGGETHFDPSIYTVPQQHHIGIILKSREDGETVIYDYENISISDMEINDTIGIDIYLHDSPYECDWTWMTFEFKDEWVYDDVDDEVTIVYNDF